MTDLERMGRFIDEFGRGFRGLAYLMIKIKNADITEADKAIIIKGMICAMLDELSSEDVKDLFNTYPEMSGREDLK